MSRVTLILDPTLPTSLPEASIQVTAWFGGRRVLEANEPIRQLTPWSESHAVALLQGRSTGWVDELYELPLFEAFRLAIDHEALNA